MYFIRNNFGFYLESFDGQSVSYTAYIHDSKGFESRYKAKRFLSKMDPFYVSRHGLHIVEG